MTLGAMRLRMLVVFAPLCLLVVVASAKGAEFEEFGFESVGAELSPTAAGAHADFSTTITFNHRLVEGKPVTDAKPEAITVDLPPGLIGRPPNIPLCGTGEFVSFGHCPVDSQVGVSEVRLYGTDASLVVPVFNLEPPHPQDEVARLGFFPGFPVFLDVSVRTSSNYGVTVTTQGLPAQEAVISANTTIWGVPASPAHDEQRLTTKEGIECPSGTACKVPGGKRSSELPEAPFFSNPTACQNLQVGFAARSYQLPGQVFSTQALLDPITDCDQVPFSAELEVEPTSRVAGAPTGLHASLRLPQVEAPDRPDSSAMRSAAVTLPEGMGIASGAADGLQACSAEQIKLGQEVPSNCSDGSKLGTATVVSPALNAALHGSIYLRTPEPGRPFRLWLAIDELGLHIKLPGEIHADSQTGRLVAEFKDLPQLPVEKIDFDIWGGERAPLKNPESCGRYVTHFAISPWSGNPASVGEAPMTIDQGCATGGFNPRLEAGTLRAIAGAFSGLLVNFYRSDGEANLAGFVLNLPKGLLAKLAGVPLCPDSEASSGGCPGGSQIGTVSAAVGPGMQPLWIPQPGKAPTALYLAGPYKGAPYSVVTKVPTQAGPFDFGTVTVRAALNIDPETGKASVVTDPLPQFIEGVPVLYRTLHISIDRPDFVINPTDCSELSIGSTVTSNHGQTANPSSRFQVDGCRQLKFSPALSLALRGGTDRGDYPSLRAVLKAQPGQANIRRASVALPHSEFLAQEHIRTICTRVQFVARHCPKGSIYGYAKAWTPLLERQLAGPVYLRSSDHALPDLVAALRGQVEIDLVGRIDSEHGGIRTTFEAIPDAPVSTFVLKMKGGPKGLLTNSTDICRHRDRATVRIAAHNGRRHNSRVTLRRQCGNSRGPDRRG